MAIASNRTGDLGTYDTELLADAVHSIGSAYGSGFSDQEWIDFLVDMGRIDDNQDAAARHLRIQFDPANVKWRLTTSKPPFDEWLEALIREAGYTDDRVQRLVLERLELL